MPGGVGPADSPERYNTFDVRFAIIVGVATMAFVAFLAIIFYEDHPPVEGRRNPMPSLPEVSQRSAGDVEVVDISPRVERPSPKDAVLQWPDLRSTLTASNGAEVLQDVRARPDDPSGYSRGPDVQVEVWYFESPPTAPT